MSFYLPKIELLSDPLIDQIAAGEVVERPASLIKEIVENSLDAKSQHIDVSLEKGGIDLVQVIDDGHGISQEDLPLAVVAHATSKIRQAEDLRAVMTRGFRGEALASMGAVGTLTLASRVVGEASGWETTVSRGQAQPLRPAALNPGTQVTLRNLFGHIPARRKFLKSPRAEGTRCLEALSQLALSTPHIHYSLKMDGRVRVQWPAVDSLGQRMSHVLKVSEIQETTFTKEGVQATICLAPPSAARQTRAGQYFFLMGRPIRDRGLSQVVYHTTREFIPDNRHPVICVHLDLDPTKVDVNVHPTKEEVRFENPRQVTSAIAEAIRQTVLAADYAAPLSSQVNRATTVLAEPAPRFKETTSLQAVARAKKPVAENWLAPDHLGASDVSSIEEKPARRFCQMHDAYIVVETDEGISVLDQHALHERVLLEKMRRQLLSGQVEKQFLLVPQLVELMPAEAAILLDLREDLEQVGFEVSDHGDGVLAVSAIPAALAADSCQEIFESVIEKSDGLTDREALRLSISRICACRSAVKAGDHLKDEEIESLLRGLTEEDYTFACEHGRPTHLRLTLGELAQGFSRH